MCTLISYLSYTDINEDIDQKLSPTLVTGCKYSFDRSAMDSGLSSCDPVTKTMTLTLTLKGGSLDTCASTKNVTKQCGRWSIGSRMTRIRAMLTVT